MNIVAQHDIAGVPPHISHAGCFAGPGHPAGDALANAQLKLRGVRRQAGRGVNFEQAVVGINQNDRAAGSAHETDCLVQNELQRLLRIQGGMNDIADLIQQF